MNKWSLATIPGLLIALCALEGYCDSHPKLQIMRNGDEKFGFNKDYSLESLSKVAEFLGSLGMSVDYEQDDIETKIANWMALSENYHLIFEEIFKIIGELEIENNALQTTLVPILERLLQEWSSLTQKWGPDDIF